jgi:hypothetical protein
MLSKCANPSCSNSFLYLHDGKLFRMDVIAENEAPRAEGKKHSQRIEYFWLCNECAASMTLRYRDGSGVVAIPLRRSRAASGRTDSAIPLILPH